MSIELKPYAIENSEAGSAEIGTSTTIDRGAFHWTTRRSGPDSSLYQDSNDSTRESVKRDAFSRPLEVEDK